MLVRCVIWGQMSDPHMPRCALGGYGGALLFSVASVTPLHVGPPGPKCRQGCAWHEQQCRIWPRAGLHSVDFGVSLAPRHLISWVWVSAVEMGWWEQTRTHICAHPHPGKSTTPWDVAKVILRHTDKQQHFSQEKVGVGAGAVGETKDMHASFLF